MKFDYSKLLGLMRERGMTQQNLADKLHISISTLNKKLHNLNEFTQTEIVGICKILNIRLQDVTEYFFAH